MFSLFATILRSLHRNQRGQVLWLTAGLIAVFGGMAALAVDLGSYMAERRNHQNAADAIALAASLELPDGDAARAVADEWAIKNDFDPADIEVEIIPQNLPDEPNPKVRVKVNGEASFAFAKLIGISSADVNAKAAAIKSSAGGGAGAIPLAPTNEAVGAASLGEPVVLKYDALNATEGNFGAIVIDGTGAACPTGRYCTNLMHGADSVLCAEGTEDTYCDGMTATDTQPGNVTGPTRNAINYRINNTDVQCDEFTEVFEDDPTTDEPDVWRIVPDCNPWLVGSYSSLRILIVPVIDELCNGSCEVTIVDFALFFLEGYGAGGCSGVDCEIIGRFVRVNQNMGLLAGVFDEDSFNQFVRLVE